MDMHEFLNRFIDFKRCSKLSLTNVYCTHSRRIWNDIQEKYFLKLDPSIEGKYCLDSIFFFQLLKTYKDKESY